MNKKEFLARIDVLLAAKHWSKARLNEEAGLPTGMIYQWYQSQSDQLPTVKSIEAVCRALGVTLSQFFYGKGRGCIQKLFGDEPYSEPDRSGARRSSDAGGKSDRFKKKHRWTNKKINGWVNRSN